MVMACIVAAYIVMADKVERPTNDGMASRTSLLCPYIIKKCKGLFSNMRMDMCMDMCMNACMNAWIDSGC